MEEVCPVEELNFSRWHFHTSCTESHVGTVCCRHREAHSSDHQCGQGAVFDHERWHPRTPGCSHIRIICSCAHGGFLQHKVLLSPITKVPIVFVGNREAGLTRKMDMRPLYTCSPMMCHCPLHPGFLMLLCETRF